MFNISIIDSWAKYVRSHRHRSYCCRVVLVIVAVSAACFVAFTICKTHSHKSSSPSQGSQTEVPFLSGDQFLVDCFNKNVNNVQFSHTPHSASLSVHVEKPSNLSQCETSVSKILPIAGKGETCQSIDIQYLIEGTELEYAIEETTGSPYYQPFFIVVCKNLSHYEAFKSNCTVISRDCTQYNVSSDGQITFSVKGEQEPRYVFIGAKFKKDAEIRVEVSGTKMEYNPMDKCQPCDEDDCSVLLDDPGKCVIVELNECKKIDTHDTTNGSRTELEQCDSTHAGDASEVTTLSYTVNASVAEKHRSILWYFTWVFFSLGTLALVIVTAAVIVLFFGQKFVCLVKT